jgi:glutamate synthase domain-containing protein 3
MSGGIAYVYDEDGQFAKRCNPAMVSLVKVLPADEQAASVDRAVWHHGQADEDLLKALIEQHHSWTGSLRAREILDDWATARARFVKVFPNEYKRALGEINAAKETTDAVAKAKGDKKATKTVPAK